MGANNADFGGSGNAARSNQFDGSGSSTDIHGAMQATTKMDGPSAIKTNTSQNADTGHTAGAVAYGGTS